MLSKKKLLTIFGVIIIIILALNLFIPFNLVRHGGSSEHDVLLLCTDPSEQRPGIGAVDMAYVIKVKNNDIKNVTPVYPGGLTHPTLEPSASMKAEGLSVVYLHDSLWSEDINEGAKIAQEIVEYHTNMTTDMVVVVTPEAVDNIINSVKPVYLNGEEVNVSSIDFLRDEQSSKGLSRGDAVEGLADAILKAADSPDKKMNLIKTGLDEYNKGNIRIVS